MVTPARARNGITRAPAPGRSGAANESESSIQRDLGVAVIAATKAVVDAVCKQLGGVHIQRYHC